MTRLLGLPTEAWKIRLLHYCEVHYTMDSTPESYIFGVSLVTCRELHRRLLPERICFLGKDLVSFKRDSQF